MRGYADSMAISIGDFVLFEGGRGVAKVLEIDEINATVGYFESIAEPRVGTSSHAVADLKHCRIGVQTRGFFEDAHGTWRAGRVVGGGPDNKYGPGPYYLRTPNAQTDIVVPEAALFVRWDEPPRDPIQVLIAGANETPLFRDARLPVRLSFVEERAVTGSVSGILSAGVALHPHQVQAAQRILRDPVQRYLLADEVGLGKTIEAGFVIRQTLIDNREAKIAVIAPSSLRRQWLDELREKFFVDDFSPTLVVSSHETPEKWSQLQDFDLVVVDEAHELAAVETPTEPRYAALAQVCSSTVRLLLLSATPATQQPRTYLAMLHLLDPDIYKWENLDEFERLLSIRGELALAIYALDTAPDPDNFELVEYQLRAITSLVPGDQRLGLLIDDIVSRFGVQNTESPLEAAGELARAVLAVRSHVAETYRLHHRMIRNRRDVVLGHQQDDSGLLMPYEVTGRRRPESWHIDNEPTAEVVRGWLAAVQDDFWGDTETLGRFRSVLPVLLSRVGGSIGDLEQAIRARDGRRHDVLSTALSGAELRALRDAPWGRADEEALGQIESLRSAGDEAVSQIAHRLARAQDGARVVVFCGRGRLASELVRVLQNFSLKVPIRAHTADVDEGVRHRAVSDWRDGGGLLVCDESGDVGLNLQAAQVAVHVRLPSHPNHLEQRIGRVDRYGTGSAAHQVITVGGDDTSLHRAWIELLQDGFQVFDRSISGLQDPINDLMRDLWSGVVTRGADGFIDAIEDVREDLERQAKDVAIADELESTFDDPVEMEKVTSALADYEDRASARRNDFVSLLAGAAGFNLSHHANSDGSHSFGADSRAPLVSPRMLRLLAAPRESRTGFFDRWALRQAPGKRLFRRGNPFMDGVERLLELDDRGQASAMWRVDRELRGAPEIYFGFDLLLSASTRSSAADRAGNGDVALQVRRIADRSLPPRVARLWIDATTGDLADPSVVPFLNAPYDKVRRRDVNLNPSRIHALHDLFGGNQAFAESLLGARETALSDFRERSGLDEAIAEACDRLEKELATLAARAEARRAAGALVVDPSAFDLDIELGRSVLAGVRDPDLRTIAVSVVVRAGRTLGAPL